MSFLYMGQGLKADQFTAYVQDYEFGSKPPTFVVLHHTSIPDASWASAGRNIWDKNEAGKSEEQIYQKRLRQLAGIKNYYQNTLGWSRGPHLFIDDRWIWLFTPMYYQGIHAAAGNGTALNYSIGIEVVGHYTSVRWPKPIEDLVGHAVVTLQRKLRTFELIHRPGPGAVSSHRDYNKPACPGDAVTNSYYLGVLRSARDRLAVRAEPQHEESRYTPPRTHRTTQPTTIRQAPQIDGVPVLELPPGSSIQIGARVRKGTPEHWLWLADGSGFVEEAHCVPGSGVALNGDTPLMGYAAVTKEQAVRAFVERERGEYDHRDISEWIVPAVFAYCKRWGVNPLVALGQLAHETDWLSSFWAGRPRRNPAGIGVTGQQSRTPPRREKSKWQYDPATRLWKRGLSFAAWSEPAVPGRTAVPAHIARLALYGAGDELSEERIAELVPWLGRPLPRSYYGCALTVKDLSGTWMMDPHGWCGIVRHMQAILDA